MRTERYKLCNTRYQHIQQSQFFIYRNIEPTDCLHNCLKDHDRGCNIWFVCLFVRSFVCLFIATRTIFQLSGSCHHYRWQGCKFRPMLGAHGLWAGRDFYRATPTATRDLCLYSLIRKTGTHVPQWDSNPRRKDHPIFAPDALTTAPRKRLWLNVINNQCKTNTIQIFMHQMRISTNQVSSVVLRPKKLKSEKLWKL
jgi:hypothetical protein